VPRLTFRQLGSVATSADALSPLGRVRAKPEPEPVRKDNFRIVTKDVCCVITDCPAVGRWKKNDEQYAQVR